jgi:nicotinamidase-related amidase
VIPEFDIWRVANLMLKRYGDEADVESAMRAEELAEAGDRAGEAIWRRGVTTEVCVNTTVREANDRGYDCVVVANCVGSYFPEFHEMGLRMIKAQGGIFGWVTTSGAVITALRTAAR